MKKKELCSICTEYSVEEKCENMSSCELQKILLENKELKKQNAYLRRQLSDMRVMESWEKFPDMMGK